MARYAKKVRNPYPDVAGWPQNSYRWLIYSDKTCQQAKDDLWAIPTWAGRIAATQSTQPALGASRACSNVTTPTTNDPTTPSFANAFRYSHNGTTLTIEIDGIVGDMSFNTVPASNTSWSNPDNINIVAGQFYGPAELSQNAPWSKRWQVNLPAGVSYKIIARQAGNASNTFSKTFTPVSGANNVVFVGSATVTNPTVTPILYSNIVIAGNSITKYGNGYGYNASSPEKDYVHILKGRILSLNPSAQVRTVDQFPGGIITDIPYWEGNHGHTDGGLTRFANIAASKPDLLYISLGENVQSATNFGNDLIDLVAYMTSQSPGCLVIIRTSIWGKADIDNIIEAVASQKGWTFVNGRNMPGATAGAENHPNDEGMLNLANLFWEKTPKSTTSTDNPTTGTGAGPLTTTYFSNGFGEGRLDQLLPSAPFFPSNNQINSWTYAQTPIQYLDNGTVKFGIGRSIGAEIQHFGLSGGKNWINTYKESGSTQDGLKAPDTGRAGGWSLYGSPGPVPGGPGFYDGGQWTGSSGDDTSFNPVQGGSRAQDRSPITFYEKRYVAGFGDVLYTKTRPYHWSLTGILAKMDIHCFWWLEGNFVCYFSIIDNYRDDNQRIYHGFQQEGPFLYTTGDLWHHKLYNGPNPGTGGGLLDISRNSPGLDSKLPVATEPWIASLNDQDNGVILLSQHNPRFMGGQFNEFGGDEFSLAASYINSAQMINMDVNVAYAFSGRIWAGSLSGFRSWYNANQARVQFRSFSFNFTPGVTCGWWTGGGSSGKFNANNQYEFTLGNDRGDGGNFCPPYGIYKASDVPVLKVTGAFYNVSQIDIRWNQNTQDDNQSNAANQVTTLDVVGDGQVRTYSVQMAGKNGWNGYIGSMRFGPHLGNAVSSNQRFVPTYIGP